MSADATGGDTVDALEALRSPSLEQFEAIAARAFSRLPAPFRARCDGVVILVQDFPDDETLAAMGAESPFDLLGLYHGVDLTQGDSAASPTDLNRVFLYRRPLLDYWAEYDETLGDLITHVLVHEIGHHFGLSDAEMEAIEAAAD